MTKRVSASNATPPGPGAARTGAEVRRFVESALAAAAKKAEMPHISVADFANALEKASTAEKVATAYRLELVAGSARSLWLRAGTEEWHLDNPTDAIQADVQAAFCHPDHLEVVFRCQSDVIVELVVQSKARPGSVPDPTPSPAPTST